MNDWSTMVAMLNDTIFNIAHVHKQHHMILHVVLMISKNLILANNEWNQ